MSNPRIRGLFVMLAVLWGASAGAQTTAVAPARRSVALVNVTHGEGFTDLQADTTEGLILDALHKTGRFEVIGRSDIAAVLTLDARKQAAGCSDDTCAAKIANALGVELVATASVGRLGETTVVRLGLLDAHGATAVARAQETFHGDDALPAAATSLARQLVVALWPNAVDDSPSAGPTIKSAGDPAVSDDGTQVAFRIVSGNDVLGPRVDWRYAGEKSFRSEPLSRGKGANLYQATLPARPVEEAVEYRVVASDASSLAESIWPSHLNTARIGPGAVTVSTAPATSTDPLVLKLTVTSRLPGQTETAVLIGGESLSAGTELAFSVSTSKPAYVYLAERHKSGTLDVLFPTAGVDTTNLVPPGEAKRIPPRTWFALDDQDIGRETVMVLASPVPLKNLDGAFSHASDGMAAGTQAGVELLAAATDVPSCRTRGFKRVTDDDCRPRTRGLILPEAETTKQHTVSLSVAARASDPFVFVPFEFEHVKKQ